jgi:hypothetical protein
MLSMPQLKERAEINGHQHLEVSFHSLVQQGSLCLLAPMILFQAAVLEFTSGKT